jgi:site-specific recombinase XerD
MFDDSISPVDGKLVEKNEQPYRRGPRLLDQVRNVIRCKHYSIRTEHGYVDWIRRYIFFHDKLHPKDMGEAHISGFLTHLAVDKKVASSTQNQALCALVFLYREVLKKDVGEFESLIRAKKPQKLPVVFTREEVRSGFKPSLRTQPLCWATDLNPRNSLLFLRFKSVARLDLGPE